MLFLNHCETGVSKINCTKCYKEFGDTPSLLKHIRKIHVGIKSFNCDVCHQSFKNIREFIKHNREIHDGDSNVKQAELEICSDCGKSFITRKLLLRHSVTVHQDAKRYSCYICDKRFRDSYGLHRHLKEGHGVTDTDNPGSNISLQAKGENIAKKKSLTCPICNRKVIKLNKHLRITHSVDRNLNPTFNQLKFQCKVCGKPFRDTYNLE